VLQSQHKVSTKPHFARGRPKAVLCVRRWFLSYNSQDTDLIRGFESALSQKDTGADIFYAPRALRAGGYWLPELSKEIAEATAFVMLVGKKGLGPWQVTEYYEAFDRRVKEPNFPVILVLLDGQPAPGLPFLRQLHWIVTSDPASEASLARLLDAASGAGSLPSKLWRHTAPYRGLAAMTEADSDFFFGREGETVEVVRTLETTPDKLPVLLGNSGVGKSSLAQAGVLASLARQDWPESAQNAGPWPRIFYESRGWCFLTIRPGEEPIRTLVEAFIDTWQLGATNPERVKQRNEWIELLIEDKATLRDLLDATERRYKELNQPRPPCFFLYVDQGEELYVRAEPRQRDRFSAILAHSLRDPRLRALMSLRSDFLGALQTDAPLFDAHHKIDVPPLRETELREVVMKPAALLGACFETEYLAADIARRAAEESVKDAGALPLLSYLLDDMWAEMVKRCDGVLRLPHIAIELGGVLAERANAFLANHPQSSDALKRLLTIKLATVREDGEPTRRRAVRSEFTDEEWRLVCELADHPHRLLITATPESGEVYAEVAHEAIFRRWEKLKEWISAEREFLAWRSGLEFDRRTWQSAPKRSKDDALLMGLALVQAQDWFERRFDDIHVVDRDFIVLSRKTAQRRKLRGQAIIGMLVVVMLAGLIGWLNQSYLQERWRWFTTIRPHMLTQVRPYVLTAESERTLKPNYSFRECAKDCPEMIVVPAGEFIMGSSDDDKSRYNNEGPQHSVLFSKPFAVSKFEVTFDDWDACVAYGNCDPNISDSGLGRGRHPVINVGSDDAQRYVTWLSKMTGKSYRLLSEAEWEYAARAGRQTAYSWGDEIGSGNANCAGCGSQWDSRQTAPAGSFAPNAFGLYDMHGNVWEWVQDCFNGDYNGAPANGSAWRTGDCSRQVIRGGSWQSVPRDLRSAVRGRGPSGGRGSGLGFRIARTLGPETERKEKFGD